MTIEVVPVTLLMTPPRPPTRTLIPPSSLSISRPAASIVMSRESACGALFDSVPLCVSDDHRVDCVSMSGRVVVDGELHVVGAAIDCEVHRQADVLPVSAAIVGAIDARSRVFDTSRGTDNDRRAVGRNSREIAAQQVRISLHGKVATDHTASGSLRFN